MDTATQGLMGPDDTIIDNFRNAILGNHRPKTLTQLLSDLSPEDAAQVQSMARMTRMMAQTYVRSQGYMEQSYEDLVKQLHRGLRPDLQTIVAMLLEQIDPAEVREKPKPDLYSDELSAYEDWKASVHEATGGIPEVTDKDIAEFSLAAGLPTEAPEPEQFTSFDAEDQSDTPDAFVERVGPKALAVAKELGIDPRIIIAQAALETGWGKSVKGNNLFGIKSHGKQNGVMVATHEVMDGKRVGITDNFRAYDTYDDSISDYGDFLRNNKRYQSMINANSLDEQIAALGVSGYATDPDYAEKIESIAKSKRLEDFA